MPTQKTLRYILADNLRRLRSSANISQEDLAELCGLHRTYISDVERCTRNISIDNIERIADSLHVSASDLLRENVNENS